MNINIDQIVQILILLLPLVPMGYLMAQFKAHRKQIEDKLIPVQQQAHVESVVRSVVMAVQQSCPDLIGPQKKYEAIRMGQQLLGEAGIHVSQSMLETLIEQAVYRIKLGQDPSQTQMIKAVEGVVGAVQKP